MPSNRALLVALAWTAALAAGCGGLADGDYGGQPLAVIQGTLTKAGPVQISGETSFALLWSPAVDHESALNLLGGATSAPVLDGSYTESCTVVVPPTEPLCDGTLAGGDRICNWTDRRLGALLRVVDYRAHLPGNFEIAVREVPPEAARYDLSRQGGFGWFALASVVAFDDVDLDGAFRLGTPADPPEPTLASSGRQSYDPGPSQPRRSYLIAYLDGLIAPEHIDPALAEVLLFLPQGFSVWIEEEWLDGHGRTTASGRSWQPIEVPIELVMPTQAVAGCESGTRQTRYLTSIPGDQAPTWCSEDRFRAIWSRTTATGCATLEERYSGDFVCATAPPPVWDCPRPASGSLIVSVTTDGYSLDRDGYLVRVDGGAPQPVGLYDSVLLPRLSPGTHTVAIDGLAGTCAVDGARTAQVTVMAGETASVAFNVRCGGPGSLLVHVQTSGQSRDPDGYAVSVDGGAPTTIPVDTGEAAVFSPPGTHLVSLSGLAGNCTARQQNPLQVNVLPDTTLDVFLQVECVLRVADLRVTVTTSGLDQDPDGYSVGLWRLYEANPISVQPIAANGSVVFADAPLGESEVVIYGLAPNCSRIPYPRLVPVVDGPTVEMALAVECVAFGGITVTAATTGADLDPDGYTVWWPSGAGWASAALPPNGSTAITGLLPGVYGLTLTGMAPNCDGPRTATATVVPGVATAVAFDIACSPFGSLVVTATTSGVEIDLDGYSVAWSGAGQGGTVAVPANGTAVITGLVAGQFQLTLGGITPNCDGPRTATATVVAGAATPVAFDVACSPGREIAFTSSADGNPEIYLVRTSSSGLTRLTADPSADRDPAWSPDGARLAFTSERDGNPEIYVMDAYGSNLRRLTTEPAADHSPAWSPDGARIAFVSERDGNPEIYVMDVDGSNPVRLTSDPAVDGDPDWSPDGARIVFSRVDESITAWFGTDVFASVAIHHLYLMNTDGSGVSRLTANGDLVGSDTEPDWAPDGSRLAFTREHYEYDLMGGEYFYLGTAVVVIQADGSGATIIAGGWPWFGPVNRAPDWSPDGAKIAFTRDGSILVTNADGTGDWAPVVDRAGQPAWRP